MRRLIVLFLAACLTACTTTGPALLLPADTGLTASRAAGLVEAHPIPADRNIHSVPLGRTESLSYHLVQIRDRESPHIHARHDLVVTVLHGHGELHDGTRALPMQSGDSAVVRRGQPHYFVNFARDPVAAFVTFAPPFDGNDNIPAQ